MKHIITLSILAFTGTLVWFAFVYYPNTIKKVGTGGNVPSESIGKARANEEIFPIKTDKYKIVFEEEQDTYYVFVEGGNVGDFEKNKNEAKSALKTAISEDKLCEFNVFYVSIRNLDIPKNLLVDPDCQ